MQTIRTKLHHYYLNTEKPDERAKYEALLCKLNESHYGKFFNVLADTKNTERSNRTESVTLETEHVFDNQWNEAPRSEKDNGRRLFDWYEAIYPNRRIKSGHWLEITPDMVEVRQTTLTCGYCGKHVRKGEPHSWHCDKCLGSEYLKPKDLPLLRLVPAGESSTKRRPELTPNELAELLPLYNAAQGLGAASREQAERSHNRAKVAALVPDAEKQAARLIENARIETAAYTWLLDNGLNILDNVIYYDHSQKFAFGWRRTITGDERAQLVAALAGFPYEYEIKTVSY